MSKMIQIRNVPDSIHKVLKVRAAMEGMTLSDYLLGELREMAARPTLAEFRRVIQSREPVGKLAISPAEIIRQMRDSR